MGRGTDCRVGSDGDAVEPAARPERPARVRALARRVALTAAVLGGFWGLWEGYRWLWSTTGWTWPFVVDYLTMPHIHEIVPAAVRAVALGGAAAARPAARVGRVHGSRGRRRVRPRRADRLHDRRRPPPLALPPARLAAVHRRLADGADPRDRADGRDLARRQGPPRLGARRRDRRLPDVLPGHDQHSARPRLGRPARARADALVRGAPWKVLWKVRVPASLPYRLHGPEGLGDGERRRCDHRRAAVRHPGRPGRRDPQLQPVLLARARVAVGDEHRRRRARDRFLRCRRRRREARRAARAGARRHERARRCRGPYLRGLEGLRQGRHARARGHRPRAPARRVRLADRPVGLRQVDAAAGDRRPDRAERRATVKINGKTAHQARLDRDYGMVFQDAGPLRLAHGGARTSRCRSR